MTTLALVALGAIAVVALIGNLVARAIAPLLVDSWRYRL